MKAEGAARDAKMDAQTETLARIESKLESDNWRRQVSVAWIGVAVAATAIIVSVVSRFIG